MWCHPENWIIPLHIAVYQIMHTVKLEPCCQSLVGNPDSEPDSKYFDRRLWIIHPLVKGHGAHFRKSFRPLQMWEVSRPLPESCLSICIVKLLSLLPASHSNKTVTIIDILNNDNKPLSHLRFSKHLDGQPHSFRVALYYNELVIWL